MRKPRLQAILHTIPGGYMLDNCYWLFLTLTGVQKEKLSWILFT